jgi:SAM-dependent MidA family methyltransferase
LSTRGTLLDVYVPWRSAWEQALYGPAGFYRRPEGPAGHFRTSVHVSPLFAGAVVTLLSEVDRALGEPERLDLVDVGCGRGELLTGVLAALPPSLSARARLTGVDVVARPPALPPAIAWADAPPTGTVGLLLAHEWLDDVPCDVVETDDAAVARRVLVAPDGSERLGDPVADPWLDRWWPLAAPGARAEIGSTRDTAWASAVGTVARGLAVAVDYGHTLGARPLRGSLTGFAHGREVDPVPDGSCDVTAHVALDAVAAAGAAVAGRPPVVTDQRAALRSLGVNGARPDRALASADPREYLRRLAAAGEAAELTEPAGLGAFGWVLQPVGPDVGFATGWMAR